MLNILFYMLFQFINMNMLSLIISSSLLMIMFINNNDFHIMISNYFYIDTCGFIMVLLSFFIMMLMIFVPKSMDNSNFMYYYSIVMLNMVLVLYFMMNNVMYFYVFFEFSLIPTLFLIMVWGYTPERMEAGLFLIMYTVSASSPLILSLFVYSKLNFSIQMNLFNIIIPSGFYYIIWSLFLMLAFLVKLPMYGAHLWLPKAHLEAPVVGSMILAGVLLKLGGYGLMRFSLYYFLDSSLILRVMIIGLGLWGGLLTSIICLRQVDMKALIAYSSVGHMSLIIGGLFTGNMMMMKGTLMMMVAHGVCSSGLFFSADHLYKINGSRVFALNKGLLIFFPGLSMFWFFLISANMAAPPTLNLVSEVLLFMSMVSLTKITMIPIISMIFFSGAYSLFLYSSINHGVSQNLTYPKISLYSRHYYIFIMHLMPLFMFILKLSIFI